MELMGKEKKKKFIITMIIITVCATMVNYGLYNILATYVVQPEDVYMGVQMNIISLVIIITVVTVIMIVIIPKDTTNELIMYMEGKKNIEENTLTPEQQVQDMVDNDNDVINDDNNDFITDTKK